MSETPKVLYEVKDAVAIITLNRPEQRNAIDAETTNQLRVAIDRLEANKTVRVGILAGAGAVFCAGMDLKAFARGEVEDVLFGPGRFAGFVSRQRSKPIIAAVKGAALAGGFELMLACDLAIAERTAHFGLPEATRGLIAGGGGAFRLGQLLPKVIANEILLTGAPVTAERAVALGLLNRVVEPGDLLAEAMHLATEIARNAPLAIASSLELAGFARDASTGTFWQANDRSLRRIMKSDDAREGAQAFSERRPPVWRGR